MRSLSWMKGQFVRSAFCIALSLGLSAAITQSVSAQTPPSTPPGGAPGGSPTTPMPPDQNGPGNTDPGSSDPNALKPEDFVVNAFWHYVDMKREIKQSANNGNDPAAPANFEVITTWVAKARFGIMPDSRKKIAKDVFAKGDYTVTLRLLDADGKDLREGTIDGQIGKLLFDTSDEEISTFEEQQDKPLKFPLKFSLLLSNRTGTLEIRKYEISDPGKFLDTVSGGTVKTFYTTAAYGAFTALGADVIVGSKADGSTKFETWRMKIDEEDKPELATTRDELVNALPTDAKLVSGRIGTSEDGNKLRKKLLDGVKVNDRQFSVKIPVRTVLFDGSNVALEEAGNYLITVPVK